MNIIVINKEIFQNRPPVISTLLTLSDLGHHVTLITVEINKFWLDELTKRKIEVFSIPDFNKRSIVNKLFEYLNFRRKVFSLLESIVDAPKEYILWVIGGNTIYSLGKKILKYRFILQIQELHENDSLYLRLFSKIINRAELVFLNEYNRTVLYQGWFQMKKRPIVLPNKPYFAPSVSELNLLKSKYEKYLAVFKKKVILYQGILTSDRDVSNYLKAAERLGEEFCVVLLGKDYGMIEKYKSVNPNIVHINHIPAPDYLLFTSMAYIGIVNYSPLIINNSYCAPNKIWEYACYGVPSICNDVPGLKYTVEASGFGVCIDEDDIQSIYDGYIRIMQGYDIFRNNAFTFYESVNTKEILAQSLKCII